MTWSSEDYAEHVRALKEALGRPDPIGIDRFRSPGPGALYIARDDQLLVRAKGFQGSTETILVRARVLDPDGRVVPHEFRMPGVGVAGVLVSQFFALSEGWLLGIQATGTQTNTQPGLLYVELDLCRGPAAAPIFMHALCGGYVTDLQPVVWPTPTVQPCTTVRGGFASFLGADPAAGAEISTQITTDRHIVLHGVRATLVTDATVATRRVHFQIFDGTTVLLDLAAADTQAASLTRNYNMENAGFARTAQDSELYLPLPHPVPVRSSWTLRTVTTNIQAGDDWGAPVYLVESFTQF